MPDLSTVDLIHLLPFIAVGFAAQLVDGALGMAFGVISTTLLISLGVPPAAPRPGSTPSNPSPPASPASAIRSTAMSTGGCSAGSSSPA
jgi:uncharacterized membrane protein YfcA